MKPVPQVGDIWKFSEGAQTHHILIVDIVSTLGEYYAVVVCIILENGYVSNNRMMCHTEYCWKKVA